MLRGKAFKLIDQPVVSRTCSSTTNAFPLESSNVFGPTTELMCLIAGIPIVGMIDTGSQVTSLSHAMYLKYFQKFQLQDVKEVFNVQTVHLQHA